MSARSRRASGTCGKSLGALARRHLAAWIRTYSCGTWGVSVGLPRLGTDTTSRCVSSIGGCIRRVVHLRSGYPWCPGVLVLRVRCHSMYCMRPSRSLIGAHGSSCAWGHALVCGPRRLPPSMVGMSSMTGLAYPSWLRGRVVVFVGCRWLIGWQELWSLHVALGAAGASRRSTAGIFRGRMSRSSRPSCCGMSGLSIRCGIGSRQPLIRLSGIFSPFSDCWGIRAWRQRSVMRPLLRMPCAGRSRPPISPVRRE